MTQPSDVPAARLLPLLAAELKGRGLVQPPEWAAFARTGVHTQQAPTQPDWWYVRSASVLRKIYLKGTTGTARLAQEYGGRRDRGSAPYHARTGSRSVTREIVQQLEKSGLLVTKKPLGRRVSPAGMKLLATTSRTVLKEMADRDPVLAKYL